MRSSKALLLDAGLALVRIWVMAQIRIDTVEAPLDDAPLTDRAVGLLRRASALGLLEPEQLVTRLDLDLLRRIARRASAIGIGQDAAIAIGRRSIDLDEMAQLIARLDEALQESPMPAQESAELLRVFPRDDLAALLGTSAVSLGRYVAGSRAWPDQLADRLHWLALVVSDLGGAYNEFGIRRWFGRPRTQLGGRSPRDVLNANWDPDSQEVLSVRELAAKLVGVGAAT
jgi:hypothetical protein